MDNPINNRPETVPLDHLLPHHRRQLIEESGLSLDVIAVRGYRSVTSKAALKRLGFTERQLLVPALLVPVWNVYGEIATYQIRPDQPRIDRKRDRVIKYETPGGARMVVDVPPAARPLLGDPTVPLLITEGAKKGDCLAQHGACVIALLGVWNWRGTNGRGGTTVLPDFEAIALNDRQVYVIFDSDVMLKASVHQALERFGAWLKLRRAHVAYIYLPTGHGGKKQGADDFLAAGHTLDELLHLATEMLKDVPVDDEADGCGGASGLATSLADQWRGTLLFDCTRHRWLAYRDPEYAREDEPRGIWRELSDEQILWRISHALRTQLENGFQWSFLAGMERLLRVELARELEPPPRHLVPLRNGVLCLSTMKLQPHAPRPAFTWQLPFDYDPTATCPTIDAWLLQAQDQDLDRVKVLKAFLRALVTGRVDLERFLELLGPAGTGKSTFERLAMALIGLENIFVTELKQLEQNRFEASNIIGKHLVIISDSERYGGEVTTLKALTGGGPVRAEEKYAPAVRYFTPEAMVIIAANQPILSNDYTSGLERRRVSVPFQHRPPTPRKLIDFDRGHAVGEFVPELAGLLNSILAISDAEMEHVLRRAHQVVRTLREAWMRSLTETNPLAAWLDECVVYEPDGRTYIGVAKQDPVTRQYEGANTWLYANYRDYADASGHRKIVPLQSFRRLMEDLCQQQLKLPNVVWGRDDQGRYFDGLRLRRELDAKAPTLIEQAVALMVRGSSIPESTQSPETAETAGTMTPRILATADAAEDAEVSEKVHRDPTHPIEANGDGRRVDSPVKEGCAPTPASVAEFSIDAGLPPLGPPASPAGSARARRSPCRSCRGRRFWVTPAGHFICAACHPPASDALAIGWLELTDEAPSAVSRNDHKGRSIAGAPGP